MSSTSIRPRLDNAHKWLDAHTLLLWTIALYLLLLVVVLALGPADLPAHGQAPGSS
jgi:hypothetical protein